MTPGFWPEQLRRMEEPFAEVRKTGGGAGLAEGVHRGPGGFC